MDQEFASSTGMIFLTLLPGALAPMHRPAGMRQQRATLICVNTADAGRSTLSMQAAPGPNKGLRPGLALMDC